VPQFGKSGCCKGDFGEWWKPLVDEPMKPAQRRPLVARWVSVRQQLAQRECVGERQSPISRAAISAA
jgi:hypothetical protein